MREWLRLIATAHAAGADTWTEGGVAVHRVTGGNNNALYRVEANGQFYACKLCVADERRRAAREYAALYLVHAAGLDVAPEPLWLDESCEVVAYPAVTYRWLAGEPLGLTITDRQLDAVLASVQLLHTLEPGQHPELTDTWFHWFDFARYLPELDEFINQYGPWLERDDPEGHELAELHARLTQFIERAERLAAS